MKTVLIPIFHGHIARNILRTNVLSALSSTPDTRVVLVVPREKENMYRNEFGSASVIVEASPVIERTFIDKLFRSMYYYFVDTDTVRIIQQEQYLVHKNYARFVIARALTKLFGNVSLLRRGVRFLDTHCVRYSLFASLFDSYRPDVVFIPSITSDDEGVVHREAWSRRIPVVGMIRSWDNLTVNKGNIRVYPDRLIVHTHIMAEEAVKYADMSRSSVVVVGMSHFDYYKNDTRMPREKFFAQFGGDVNKKTIYFMPIGLSDDRQDRAMLAFLEKLVSSDVRFKKVQLMMSMHPNTTKEIDYAAEETVIVKFPGSNIVSSGKLTNREITKDDMEIMASAIYHSDVVVNYQGTTSIDASAFDKPVVNIAFDETPGKVYETSVRRFYDFTHYLPILRSGGVRVANSYDDLREMVADYLEHPEHDREGRSRMVREQNPMFDGHASERTAAAIVSIV